MIVYPNAKINLGLKVLRKRTDGFHDIETLFYPVPLYDVMEILPAKAFLLEMSGHQLDVDMKENIVYKAWEYMNKLYHATPIHVILHKQIPSGAGLGGGSSDAAFMLDAINKLYGLGASKTELLSVAAKIGSDCAFFLYNEPCLATGRGEIIEPVAFSLKSYYLCIIKPDVHVHTAHAYAGIKPSEAGLLPSDVFRQPVEMWQKNLLNDFEHTIFQKFPGIAKIKQDLLGAGAVYSAMSGSGASVFALFEEPPALSEYDFPECFFWMEKI